MRGVGGGHEQSLQTPSRIVTFREEVQVIHETAVASATKVGPRDRLHGCSNEGAYHELPGSFDDSPESGGGGEEKSFSPRGHGTREFQPTSRAAEVSLKDFSRVAYRPVPSRAPSNERVTGSLARPNSDDTLKRVAVVVLQHIRYYERLRQGAKKAEAEQRTRRRTGGASASAGEGGAAGRAVWTVTPATVMFNQDTFVKTRWDYTHIRVPCVQLAQYVGGAPKREHEIPTTDAIYRFMSTLFVKARLTAECSVVCLIYVERLMDLGAWRVAGQVDVCGGGACIERDGVCVCMCVYVCVC